jgi:hypothetical protein
MVKVDMLQDPDLAVAFGMQGSFATQRGIVTRLQILLTTAVLL